MGEMVDRDRSIESSLEEGVLVYQTKPDSIVHHLFKIIKDDGYQVNLFVPQKTLDESGIVEIFVSSRDLTEVRTVVRETQRRPCFQVLWKVFDGNFPTTEEMQEGLAGIDAITGFEVFLVAAQRNYTNQCELGSTGNADEAKKMYLCAERLLGRFGLKIDDAEKRVIQLLSVEYQKAKSEIYETVTSGKSDPNIVSGC